MVKTQILDLIQDCSSHYVRKYVNTSHYICKYVNINIWVYVYRYIGFAQSQVIFTFD